jgi:signal transduction histidine kinase
LNKTDKVQFREAAMGDEKIFRVLDIMDLPIIVTDKELQIQYCNEKASVLVDNSRNFLDILNKNYHENFLKSIRRFPSFEVTTDNQKDKQPVFVKSGTSYKLVVKPFEGERLIIQALCLDTDRIREMVLENEKFLTAGQLTVGIMHEINNPLTSAFLNMDMAKRKIISEGLALEKIDESLIRIQKVIEVMKNLFKKSPQQSTEHLAKILRDCVNMMYHNGIIQSGKTSILFEDDTGDPEVFLDVDMFKIAVNNILKNAAEAIEQAGREKGIIEITLQRQPNNKGYILIRIKDNGVGMSEETKKRLFSPFFTTKSLRGMGYGLMIVSSVIACINGRIEVESSYGHGTAFNIYIPERSLENGI